MDIVLLRRCLFDPLTTVIQLRIPSGMVSGPLKFSRKYEPLTQGRVAVEGEKQITVTANIIPVTLQRALQEVFF